MQPGGYAQYRTVTTQTATPGDLLLQLYQAAIKNAGQASEAIDRRDPAKAHGHIVRVQDIVIELRRTLDHERGGDVSVTLDRLYGYMLQRLVAANIDKDRAPLAEVTGLLRQLLTAWRTAVREAGRPAASGAALAMAAR